MATITSKLDKAFVEKLVKEPIDSFLVKKGSEKGDNVAGDIFAIQVNTSSKKVLNLVHKVLPSGNPMLKQYAIENRVFELEIHFYTTVTDKVKELLKAQAGHDPSLPVQSLGLPIPRYFGGICDDEDSYMVLEDERPNGFRMSNKYRGYDLPEASIIMKELGRFHAFTYFLIRHEGEKFFSSKPGLERYAKGFWNDSTNLDNAAVAQELYGKSFLIAMDVVEEKIGDSELAAKVRSKIRIDSVGATVRQTGAITDREIFPVIVHGDLWTNNVLLKYDSATSAPVAAKFIDFQQTRRGNIYEDLLYFVYTSTTPEFRKDHLAQVLHTYYESFAATLDYVGVPMPGYFTEGYFIDKFFSQLIPIYLYMLYAIPLQLGKHEDPDPNMGKLSKEEALAILLVIVERLYSSSPEAIERLEGLTRELVGLKVF